LSYLKPKPFKADPKSDEEASVLETHYFVNNAWITSDLLLKAARRIRVPVLLVQGQYDMVCPASSAILLKDNIPHAKLVLVSDAGHATKERGIFRALRKGLHSL
jgi:proline iminopeptidase